MERELKSAEPESAPDALLAGKTAANGLSEPRRVVFCDVDGVLNNHATRTRPCAIPQVENQEGKALNPAHLPPPEMLSLLGTLLRNSDAALVLSSSWR